ncbi:cytochrome P450 [Globomyces pollinis-pini]|nr:cytochrome P450 [Globomyces pollinis-pini]
MMEIILITMIGFISMYAMNCYKYQPSLPTVFSFQSMAKFDRFEVTWIKRFHISMLESLYYWIFKRELQTGPILFVPDANWSVEISKLDLKMTLNSLKSHSGFTDESLRLNLEGFKKHQHIVQSIDWKGFRKNAIKQTKVFGIIMEHQLRKLCNEGKGSVELDFEKFIYLLFLDIMGKVIASTDVESLQSFSTNEFSMSLIGWNKLKLLLEKRDEVSVFLHYPSELGSGNINVLNTNAFVRNIFKRGIRNAAPNSLIFQMKSFLNIKPDSEKMEELDIVLEGIDFLSMSMKTIPYVTTKAIFELARNPKCLKKLQKVLPKSISDMDDLSSITYLDNVIKEVLRLHPPITSIERQALCDIKICENIIPSGALLYISIKHLHTNEKYWKNPMEFNPDRWSKLPIDGSYYPFGFHQCTGEKTSIEQIKIIIYTIFHNFAINCGDELTTISLQ